MATAPTYCTHRQLKDVFPQVNSFDTKRPLYSWTQVGGTGNIWRAYNTGLVTKLFKDGADIGQGVPSTASAGVQWSADLDASMDSSPDADATDNYHTISYGSMAVESESEITVGDIGKFTQTGVDASLNEYALVTAINTSTNKITVERGKMGTTPYGWSAAAIFTDHFSLNANEWMYNSEDDEILLYSTSDPNDSLYEAGEDFSTLITRTTANASRYLDAKLDPNLPKEQLRDKEGNFDYIIVRTTALIAAVFLIRAHDPTSEQATALMEDALGNIDALNKGGAALSWQTTGDSSKGVIRDVTYTSGSVRPVDTRGRWSGSWDLIKVSISDSTAGVIGTAKYNVYVKDSDGLKNNQVVTEEVITGDYQLLAGGLQIRFGGSTDASVATASNEWEVEVAGWAEEVDNSSINSVKMTRGGSGASRFGKYK